MRAQTRTWLARLLCLILALALTAGVIAFSRERGRLATYPKVDDVIYMARGAELLRAARDGWSSGGPLPAVSAAGANWRADPPHSPWTTLCAAIGFGTFGVQEWAAYVLTALPVLAFLLAAARIARRAGGASWKTALLLVLAASAPFLASSVHNLKPDYAAGILSAIAMMSLLRGPLLSASTRRLSWSGICFGLALLVKPSMMVPTLLLMAGTLGICLLRDLALGGPALRAGRLLRSLSRATTIVLGTATLTALPHFAFAIGHAWGYTMHVLSDGEKWTYPGTTSQRVLYYLTGPGGRLMLDGMRTLALLGLLIGGYAAWAAWGGRGSASSLRKHRRSVYFAAMALAVIMAWAGPTITPAKIAQFASAFSALLWLVAIYAAAGLLRNQPQHDRSRRWISLATIVTLVGLIVTWRPAFPHVAADPTDPIRAAADTRTRLVNQVYSAVSAASKTNSTGDQALPVLVTGSQSDLGPPLLTLWSIRDGLRLNVREVRRIPRAADAGAAEKLAWDLLGSADVVVASEYGTGLSKPKLETEGADAYYLSLARLHPSLERIARIETLSGRGVEVFRRRAQPGTR